MLRDALNLREHDFAVNIRCQCCENMLREHILCPCLENTSYVDGQLLSDVAIEELS